MANKFSANKLNDGKQYPKWLTSKEIESIERARRKSATFIQRKSTNGMKKKTASTEDSETTQVGVISDESCVCRLCLEIIEEPNYTNEDQDVARSIFCDGECNGWLHRRCAGLSLTGFATAVESSSDEDFFCTWCQLKKQAKEINDLKATVLSLTIEVNEL